VCVGGWLAFSGILLFLRWALEGVSVSSDIAGCSPTYLRLIRQVFIILFELNLGSAGVCKTPFTLRLTPECGERQKGREIYVAGHTVGFLPVRDGSHGASPREPFLLARWSAAAVQFL